jgi:cobalt-zinc-cadmium efflux system outer membrane protein
MTRCCLILAAAACAWGQAGPDAVLDPVNGRTAAELVRLAVEQNGDLLAGRQRIAAARGDLLQAGLRPNPMVDVSGMREAAGPMNSFMVGGSLPLELYHRRDRRVEVAEAEVRVAELEQAERERRLRQDVELAFGEILAALRNLQFTNELLALNREALQLTQARADQGAAPTLDADLLRVEVNRIDALRLDLEARLGVAVLELKSLAGLPPEETLRLRGSLETEPPAIAQEEAVARALETRPDVLAARAMEAAAAARLKQAETEGRPDATVSANYQRSDSGFDVNGFTSTGQLRRVQGIFHLFTVGVSVSWPVRNRNQGAVAAAAAELEAARRRREYAELIARREVAAAFLARAKAAESLDVYRQGVRGQAQQNLAVIRRVYELGRSQLLDVIGEQRRFIDVELGYTEALNRHYQAAARLRAAANLE